MSIDPLDGCPSKIEESSKGVVVTEVLTQLVVN